MNIENQSNNSNTGKHENKPELQNSAEPNFNTQKEKPRNDFEVKERALFDRFETAFNIQMERLQRVYGMPPKFIEFQRETFERIMKANLDPETISRRERGEMESSFFLRVSPENYVIELTEAGLPHIIELIKHAEKSKEDMLEKIQPTLDRINTIISRFEDSIIAQFVNKVFVNKKIEIIKKIKGDLERDYASFVERMDQVKELNFAIENNLKLPDIEGSLKQLEQIIGNQEK